MNAQTKRDIRKLVEIFWEFESGWGASRRCINVALRLQKTLGYKTKWDKARQRAKDYA